MSKIENIGALITGILDMNTVYISFYNTIQCLPFEVLNEPVCVESYEKGIGKVTTFSEYADNLKDRIEELSQEGIKSKYGLARFLYKEKAIPIDARYFFI